ncbi:hypothetical protein E4U21_007461 [Claviceps maximensis]|nr:hypothetical protein E4U21_007461 [Claviceps maximensis]
MVSSCKLSNEIRGYNLPPVQQQKQKQKQKQTRSRRGDPSTQLYGFLQDPQPSNTMSDIERMDETSSQRKRIAVAVSSQEVQGVRPTSFNYNVALSRKLANRHAGLSPTLSSSVSPYGQNIMATVSHGDGADQHEITYGCVPKHYDQVHGWAQGYGGDHGMDYNSPAPSALPMNEQLYMMGSYRSGHPMVVRSNVVYVDTDTSSYGYGSDGNAAAAAAAAGLDTRSTSLSDPSHSFQNGMSCYPHTAVDHPGRCISISADRSRSGSSHAEGLADRRTSPLVPAMEGAEMVDINGGYHGYESGSCNGSSSLDRSSGMYTTTPPDELLVHGRSLRSSIPDYAYRYAETTSERSGQASGGSMMAMEEAQYFPTSRGCYGGGGSGGGNGLGTANNSIIDGRTTSLAGLHG